MLREASISELTSKHIAKDQRVLVNRGRGNDELAPDDALFNDFRDGKRALEKELGKGGAEAHNRAFVDCGFVARFRGQIESDGAALTRLEEIVLRARDEDLYLVCYEGAGKACHRRILMRLATEKFGTEVAVEGVEPD